MLSFAVEVAVSVAAFGVGVVFADQVKAFFSSEKAVAAAKVKAEVKSAVADVKSKL